MSAYRLGKTIVFPPLARVCPCPPLCTWFLPPGIWELLAGLPVQSVRPASTCRTVLTMLASGYSLRAGSKHHFAKPLAPLMDKWWLGNYLFERHLRLQFRFFVLRQVTSARREPVPPPPPIQALPEVPARGIPRRWGGGGDDSPGPPSVSLRSTAGLSLDGPPPTPLSPSEEKVGVLLHACPGPWSSASLV